MSPFDEYETIPGIALRLKVNHSTAWRFARKHLGEGQFFGTSRVYSRAAVNAAIAAKRKAR